MTNFRKLAAASLVVLLLYTGDAQAYSVLTHEELIDLTWDSDIVPSLKQRFPTLTADELREAHAYAYGGAVVQDIGYYPFGDMVFSEFTHYVRTGDFVGRPAAADQRRRIDGATHA